MSEIVTPNPNEVWFLGESRHGIRVKVLWLEVKNLHMMGGKHVRVVYRRLEGPLKGKSGSMYLDVWQRMYERGKARRMMSLGGSREKT